ncbi:hypothetical protein AGMMS49579_01100 [Spirochaetia bacterium]|nr:hypothetical protein AGMMS49579_01100 [Spirochaetia bacterium]
MEPITLYNLSIQTIQNSINNDIFNLKDLVKLLPKKIIKEIIVCPTDAFKVWEKLINLPNVTYFNTIFKDDIVLTFTCVADTIEVLNFWKKLIHLPKIRYFNTICKNGIVYFYVKFEGEPLHIEEQYTQLKYLDYFPDFYDGYSYCKVYNPFCDKSIYFEEMIVNNTVIGTYTFFKDEGRYQKIIFGTKTNFYNPVKCTFVTFEDLVMDPNVIMIPYEIDCITYYYLEFKKDDEIVYVYDREFIDEVYENINKKNDSTDSGFPSDDDWDSDC